MMYLYIDHDSNILISILQNRLSHAHDLTQHLQPSLPPPGSMLGMHSMTHQTPMVHAPQAPPTQQQQQHHHHHHLQHQSQHPHDHHSQHLQQQQQHLQHAQQLQIHPNHQDVTSILAEYQTLQWRAFYCVVVGAGVEGI